jgi:hypothetical protein
MHGVNGTECHSHTIEDLTEEIMEYMYSLPIISTL